MAAMAAGPGAAGTARVSSGRELGCVPEVAAALGAVARQGFDFLCAPLFHPRHRREFRLLPAKERPGPQTRSDLLLAGRGTGLYGVLWALQQELDFAAYLGVPAVLLSLKGPHCPNLARGLCAHLQGTPHGAAVWVRVPLLAPESSRDDLIVNEELVNEDNGRQEEETWHWWHNFRTLCDYNKRVGLALEVGPDLPSAEAIDRWLGEPLRAAILPTSIFLTNKKGFPVLSRPHQRLLGRLLKLEVQVVLWGAPHHEPKPLSSYLQYLEHVGQNRPPPSAYELFARGYEDYLQCPLQPLMDNLESQTYEVFEKDPIKYSQYQQAIYKCLLDRVPDEEKETNVQVVLVLGAGRGPLVNAALRAARMAQRRISVYAVEKNHNAVVTLQCWQLEQWGSQLLGSFGDNELAPECLDGAQPCLKPGGVSIPCSYTSFLAPLSSSKLYNEVRGCRERDRHPEAQFETPYVVRLHNFHQLAAPQPCFTFQHPKTDPDEDNSRYAVLSFPIGVTTALHGFAGYFETTLYGDVTLSIRPETHSPGMFSWFPIFFPLKQPMALRAGDTVRLSFWRRTARQKVWYEWAVTQPAPSALHNPAGRSYTIGL
uniref:Protein arginine N-methyltransferase 5 n=1 Tax=Coturnix japonica TaxID=93934 RepID=A0A8C2SYI2_COTJA